MSSELTDEEINDLQGLHNSRPDVDESIRVSQLTVEQFRALEWVYARDGSITTADPANVPLIERFLAAKSDPGKLRAFIEDLGGTWDATPYSPDET
jgi:hypothetical protein